MVLLCFAKFKKHVARNALRKGAFLWGMHGMPGSIPLSLLRGDGWTKSCIPLDNLAVGVHSISQPGAKKDRWTSGLS